MTGAGPALPPRRPAAWLLAAFLLPNLGALACGFVLDDLPLVADNATVHSLANLPALWGGGLWPDRPGGLVLYRPLTQTLWALSWTAGGGAPVVFHAVNLALGAAATFLAWRVLRTLASDAVAYAGAILFALFPIHTEATTSVVGSAELLAAVLGLGALLAYRRGRPLLALAVWTAALFAKESAAAVAALALLLAFFEVRPRPWRRLGAHGAAAAAGLALYLGARSRVASGFGAVPAVDNPAALLDAPRRLLTALWVQVLYLAKTLFPTTLSADYSYQEVRLVMGLDDVRAWAGLALVAGAVLLARRRADARTASLLWAVPFLPASNVLFPIGTLLGERLAYLPSLGAALLAAALVGPLLDRRQGLALLAAVALAFGVRTAVRNLDWRSADVFYPRLVETSPRSAKSWYFLGALHAARGRDEAAVAAYDEATAIFPAYAEAFHNRGNALARLGRREEAMESYRQCLRFDAGHDGAARNLATLAAGLPLSPPRRRL